MIELRLVDFFQFLVQGWILHDHLSQLVDVTSHEYLLKRVHIGIQTFQPCLDQFKLSQLIVQLILVLLSDFARATLTYTVRLIRAAGALRWVKASMVITRVDLMRLCNHVIVETVLLIDLKEA